jgi:hypothetical protein
MARGRRLRKNASGELQMSKENGTTLDDAILLPNVIVWDKANVEPHVAVTVEQNMAAVDEAIGDQSSVTTNQPIGEQNGALS